LSYASPLMISRSYLLSPLCCPVKCFRRVRFKVLSLSIRCLCQVSLLDVIVSLPHLRGGVPHNLHSGGGATLARHRLVAAQCRRSWNRNPPFPFLMSLRLPGPLSTIPEYRLHMAPITPEAPMPFSLRPYRRFPGQGHI